MQPWIRKYNYITDYQKTAYDLYVKLYPAHPVTYYRIDVPETVWEDTKLFAGTYEKSHVGNFSGVKWKKISMLPVSNIQQVQMEMSSDDRGITYSDSLDGQTISFPSVYGFKPLEGDVVDLNYGFQTKAIKIKPLFVVTGVDLAHQSDFYNIYNLQIKTAPFDLTQLEKQISSYYKFVEDLKAIYPLEKANFLLNMLVRGYNLSDNINNLFNSNIGFFIMES